MDPKTHVMVTIFRTTQLPIVKLPAAYVAEKLVLLPIRQQYNPFCHCKVQLQSLSREL